MSQSELSQLNQKLQALAKIENLRWEYATEYHLNTSGEEMTFDDKPYLVPIYKDMTQKIVVKKSVQCGMSEWAICDCFSLAERGLNILYILPKYTLRNRFVKRIDKVVSRSEYYRENIGDTDSLWQKRYCGSDVVFASSNTDSDFVEFPADCIIIDELNRCDQENIALAPDRLSASPYKLERQISTPKYEGEAIDVEYNSSDKKEWHIKCSHCGEAQPLKWKVNVVNEVKEGEFELFDTKWTEDSTRDIHVLCRSCHKPLNRFANGKWIAEYPDINISGYHINKLFSARATIAELWNTFQKAQYNQTLMRIFYNSDLGLAYTPEGDSLTNVLISQCVGDYAMLSKAEDEQCYMGIDVGNLLHVIIGTKDKILFIGTRSKFSECSALIDRYNVVRCVVDMRPETRKAKEFQTDNKQVFLCEYIDNDKTRMKTLVTDRKTGKVQAHRTQSIDDMSSGIQQAEIQFPKNAPTISDFYDQLKVPTRVIEERARGAEAIWTKGVDHYFHAMNYWNVAKSIVNPIYVSF